MVLTSESDDGSVTLVVDPIEGEGRIVHTMRAAVGSRVLGEAVPNGVIVSHLVDPSDRTQGIRIALFDVDTGEIRNIGSHLRGPVRWFPRQNGVAMGFLLALQSARGLQALYRPVGRPGAVGSRIRQTDPCCGWGGLIAIAIGIAIAIRKMSGGIGISIALLARPARRDAPSPGCGCGRCRPRCCDSGSPRSPVERGFPIAIAIATEGGG